jgi:hypothetical protein
MTAVELPGDARNRPIPTINDLLVPVAGSPFRSAAKRESSPNINLKN